MSGVSADPAEQLGAKNSISPKNDFRSFCSNVTICKVREFKIARKIEIIENRTNNRKCLHKKSHGKNLDNRNKNRIRSLSEVSHRSLTVVTNIAEALRCDAIAIPDFKYHTYSPLYD